MEKTNGNKGPLDIQIVLKIFCIIILLFGITLFGEGTYGVVKNIQKANEPKEEVPSIKLIKENNDLTIEASYSNPLAKLVYNWNDESNTVIMGDGTGYIETTIKLLNGVNTLNITVMDTTGKETFYQKEYDLDTTDRTNPKIELIVSGNNIKVVATDETELAYMTYKWNQELETTVNTSEEEAKIELEIEIPKGENELIVTAIDTSNNMSTKTQKVKGVTKPKINVTQDGEYLVIEAIDEEKMEKVEYVFNGQTYLLNFTDETGKIVKYKQKLDIGENRIYITAYNAAGATSVFDGVCHYNP